MGGNLGRWLCGAVAWLLLVVVGGGDGQRRRPGSMWGMRGAHLVPPAVARGGGELAAPVARAACAREVRVEPPALGGKRRAARTQQHRSCSSGCRIQGVFHRWLVLRF